MVEPAEDAVTASVTADLPLVRRGLVRVATGAGFTVVPAHTAAQVSLRWERPGSGTSEPSSAVDLVVEAGSVVMTLRQMPALSTLRCLHSLLAVLLDGGAQPHPSPRRSDDDGGVARRRAPNTGGDVVDAGGRGG